MLKVLIGWNFRVIDFKQLLIDGFLSIIFPIEAGLLRNYKTLSCFIITSMDGHYLMLKISFIVSKVTTNRTHYTFLMFFVFCVSWYPNHLGYHHTFSCIWYLFLCLSMLMFALVWKFHNLVYIIITIDTSYNFCNFFKINKRIWYVFIFNPPILSLNWILLSTLFLFWRCL